MRNRITAIRLSLRDSYLRLYTHNYVRISRRRTAKRTFIPLKEHCTPFSEDLWKDITAFWAPYRNVKKERAWFEFYNTNCENKDLLKYYIPDTIYYAEIDTFSQTQKDVKH